MHKTTIAALALCAMPVYAATGGSVAECATISDNANRLACFDALSKDTAKDVAGRGAWIMNVRTSPMDDSKSFTIRLSSQTQTNSGYSRRRPHLIIKCDNNQTDVLIFWDEYLIGDRLNVATRIGRSPAITRAWVNSTNNKATFEPNRGPEFVRRLMRSNKFAAQLRQDNGEKSTAVFDTTGLAEAVKPLRNACNW